MKKPVLGLALLIAATGSAFAGDEIADLKFLQTQRTEESVVLDIRSTGAIKPAAEVDLRQTGAHAAATGERRLGIDVNPWVMPVFH